MIGRPTSLPREEVKDFHERTGTRWEPKRVLDLGARPGGNAAAMAGFGRGVTAVEVSGRDG